MKNFLYILFFVLLSAHQFSCCSKKTNNEEKYIVLHWSNPDICTNDNFFVQADICEFCGREQITTHHIDTLKCGQVENYFANPNTNEVRIKLFISDLGKENQEMPTPLWVKKAYKFESDTLTINFTKNDYEISPFMPK